MNYVGGIIFYIDTTADGTYTFKNALGETATPSVGTDCTGWTYTVTGASKDKYYVVYNQRYSNAIWGGEGTFLGADGTAIGTGRGNTELAIGSTADVSGSIWETIRTMRANEVGGCDDWYVGSKDEMERLRSSYIMDFAGHDYWTSSEVSDDGNGAWYWSSMRIRWYEIEKNSDSPIGIDLVGIRAF